ncbi:hypothetical protein DFP72DRAFT_1063440 [Ephemerocybe angulata]|uniref:Uncharacterized protein n=1 Tax=Ephemerocybe angulata TaxID=980116 RepID=A0A8H6I8E0_9AGAR|nr:hypothetical protein DFP72DRAFT_1063440 [Tulosesus angulatus]
MEDSDTETDLTLASRFPRSPGSAPYLSSSAPPSSFSTSPSPSSPPPSQQPTTPGGAALQQFHSVYNPHTTKSPVHVHISNLTAQTGASLFTQIYSQPQWDGIGDKSVNWVYNKTEGLTLAEITADNSPFTHPIVEELPSASVLRRRGWEVVSAVCAYGGVDLRRGVLKEWVFRGLLMSPQQQT